MLVADIDFVEGNVFQLRQRGDEGEEDFGIHFDNVVFLLNTIDYLADEHDLKLLEIRKRQPIYRTLARMESTVEDYRQKFADKQVELKKEFDKAVRELQPEREEADKELRDAQEAVIKAQETGEPSNELVMRYLNAKMNAEVVHQQIKDREDRLTRDFERNEEINDRELNSDLRHEQNFYKLAAVLVPPIFPFIIAAFVFFSRRAQEREGVSKSRLR